MQNKSFCVAPWVHMHIEPTGDVQLCCASNWKHDFNRSMGNLNNSTPLEIWNSDRYKHVRTSMIKGDMLTEYCSPCYLRENGAVNQTERQRLNKDFPIGYDLANQTKSDGSLDTIDIRYLDIRFNNLCNLKCRTCGPDWSTSWANELGIEHPLHYNDAWKKIIPYLNNLEKVYFAGGEPMMASEHYDFLEHLLDVNPNVELLYTSNFTRLELKDRHVMDYWPKFKLVNAVASIDHISEYAAYVRTGSDYNQVKRNVLHIKSQNLNNVRPAITTVLSLYNITKIGDIIVKFFNDGMLNNMNEIVFNLLVNPDYQSALIINDYGYELALENIDTGITYLKANNHDTTKLDNIKLWLINNREYNADKFKKFVDYNRLLDTKRGTCFEELYYEYTKV